MNATHRHAPNAEHEHEFEPQHGMPEVLPASEQLLWQGGPDWRAMAIEVFHVRKLAFYFAAILLLRGAFVVFADGGGLLDVIKSWTWLLPTAAIAVGIMLVLARLAAQATVYSITNRRVVMRIGIVLTVTFNLPFKRIEGAGLMLRGKDGHGDIPITLAKGERIAILQLWPHARPWQIARPQPALRCLPDAAAAGRVLAQAWSAATGLAAARPEPRNAANEASRGHSSSGNSASSGSSGSPGSSGSAGTPVLAGSRVA